MQTFNYNSPSSPRCALFQDVPLALKWRIVVTGSHIPWLLGWPLDSSC